MRINVFPFFQRAVHKYTRYENYVKRNPTLSPRILTHACSSNTLHHFNLWNNYSKYKTAPNDLNPPINIYEIVYELRFFSTYPSFHSPIGMPWLQN